MGTTTAIGRTQETEFANAPEAVADMLRNMAADSPRTAQGLYSHLKECPLDVCTLSVRRGNRKRGGKEFPVADLIINRTVPPVFAPSPKELLILLDPCICEYGIGRIRACDAGLLRGEKGTFFLTKTNTAPRPVEYRCTHCDDTKTTIRIEPPEGFIADPERFLEYPEYFEKVTQAFEAVAAAGRLAIPQISVPIQNATLPKA